jgi:beta-galactosidase/beta-glucuronidase
MLDSWLNWGLDQFSGYVDYRTAFVCDANDGRIILDLGKVKHMAEVWLNGQCVGARLWPPFEFDISSAVRRGSNELHIRIGNLIANAMRQFAPKLEAKSGSVWRSRAPTEQDFDAGLFGPVRVKKNLRSGH